MSSTSTSVSDIILDIKDLTLTFNLSLFQSKSIRDFFVELTTSPYKFFFHRSAKLDPLGIYANESFPSRPGNVRSKNDLSDGYAETLTVGFHGFDPEKDLDREMNFKGTHTGGNKGFLEDLTNVDHHEDHVC